MTMTPECIERLKGLLREAEAAYHQLMLGGGVREVRDQNGEAVSYSQANRQALYNYILQLRAALGPYLDDCCSPAMGAQPKPPMGFVF